MDYIAENLLRDYTEYLNEASVDVETLNKILKSINQPSDYVSKEEAQKAIIDYYMSKKNDKDRVYASTNPAVLARNAGLAAEKVIDWVKKGSLSDAPVQKDKESEKLTYVKKDEGQEDTSIPEEEFPKYEAFRKKWYDKTVSMGWPADIKYPKTMGVISKTQTEKGVTYPWSGSKITSFVFGSDFNNSMWTSVTKEIKNKLYAKFKNNIKGLKNLHAQVEKIVTAEETYLKEVKAKTSKTGKALSLAGGFGKLVVSNLFYGIGGKDSDLSMFKYLFGNKNKMTFFMYQQMIIEQMLILMEVDDNVSSILKDKLANLRKVLENDFKTKRKSSLVLTPTKFEYKFGDLVASFDVKTKDSKTGGGAIKLYDPFFTTVNVLFDIASEDTIDEYPDKDQYERIIKEIKDKKLEGTEIGQLLANRNSKTIKFVQYDTLKTNDSDKKTIRGKYIFEVVYMANFCTVSLTYEPSSNKDEGEEQ